MQFLSEGRYVANVVDVKGTFYGGRVLRWGGRSSSGEVLLEVREFEPLPLDCKVGQGQSGSNPSRCSSCAYLILHKN
jgi:hypothetical protein